MCDTCSTMSKYDKIKEIYNKKMDRVGRPTTTMTYFIIYYNKFVVL